MSEVGQREPIETSQNTELENDNTFELTWCRCFIFNNVGSSVALKWLMVPYIHHTETADVGDSHNIFMQVYLPAWCQ